jgi:hypothetical protein
MSFEPRTKSLLLYWSFSFGVFHVTVENSILASTISGNENQLLEFYYSLIVTHILWDLSPCARVIKIYEHGHIYHEKPTGYNL